MRPSIISFGINDDVAEWFGEGNEVAFGIDDDLLYEGSAFFEEAAQEV